VKLLKLLLDNCGALKKLILQFCHLGEDSTGLLTNIVASYPDLEVLVLEGCHPLTYAGYLLIPRLQKLYGLNLSHCKVDCYAYVIIVFKALPVGISVNPFLGLLSLACHDSLC
jgi:hypothetical protein